MSTFPSLAPTTRLYVPGDLPSVRQTSLSGVSSGFRRGNRRIGQSLSMSFEYLTEAQMLLLKDHYIERQGTFDIFYLSAKVWGDHVTPPVPLISDFVWRYASAIAITDISFDRFSVEVELETIPIALGDVDIELPGGGAGPSPEPGPSPPPPPPPVVDYIYDGLTAALLPVREYIINSGGSQ
jgi:hypothetical protein